MCLYLCVGSVTRTRCNLISFNLFICELSKQKITAAWKLVALKTVFFPKLCALSEFERHNEK